MVTDRFYAMWLLWERLLLLCAQYNTVPGSDEEMEWGLASDVSAASDVGEILRGPQEGCST